MNTSQSHIDNQDSHKSPERLEEEVNQTRARIGERLDTLSDRLSPGEVLDQVLGMAREHGGEFTRNLGSQVKSNPLPLIITGIGMSWLMMASNTPKYPRSRRIYGAGYDHDDDYSPRYTDGYSEYPYTGQSDDPQRNYERSMNNDQDEPGLMDEARDAMDKVGEKVEGFRNAARDKMDRASNSVHRKMDRASQSMHRNMGSARQNMRSMEQNVRSAQECVTDFMYEQPVLAASLGVALGAAIGALLPATEVEDRFMGSARDEAVTRAQSVATDEYGKVREKARHVADNVKQQMQGQEDNQTSDAPGSDYAESRTSQPT